MGDKIFIGNFSKGLTQNRLPFVIDNDAFPVLINSYCWRGRIKRKRGTKLLARLELQIESEGSGTITTPWTSFTGNTSHPEVVEGSIIAQINSTITGATQAASCVLIANNNFNVGQSVFITGVVGMSQLNNHTYLITARSSTTLTLNVNSSAFTPYSSGGNAAVFATSITNVNLVTGAFTANFSTPFLANGTVIVNYSYFPCLPVMGLEDYIELPNPYPLTVAFDTRKAYQLFQSSNGNSFYNVSYYKSTGNPVSWTGEDFQQFWTTNYQGAFWATNNVPGLHIVDGAYISGSGSTTIVITISGPGAPTLVISDVLFFNEWPGGDTINLKTGTVSSIAGSNYSVTFPSSVTASSTGKVFLLTNSVSGVGDGIRWYDGDPTAQTGLNPSGIDGWVNFSPPLSLGPTDFVDYLSQQYYLAGATAIIPFKDRILFFGPWIQSSTSAPTQLQDTVIWSWNGTPYYSEPAPLAPSGFAYGTDVTAFYVNVTGKGGFLSAGTAQSIVTVIPNEDVLLVGFTGKKTRLEYTGDDFFPFLFYTINSELGSSATFSGITLDRGGLDIGAYGLALTTQVSSERIDLVIPDVIFDIASTNNGVQRVNSARDFFREWIYFTYPSASSNWIYPTQTLHYNYRDNTWGIFYENFTVHGSFRRINSTLTWAQVGSFYPTWSVWNDPWDSSTTTIESPSVIAGNQQGFVMQLDVGTGEGFSGYIVSIAQPNPNTNALTINSPNHCLMENDYIQLNNILGFTSLNEQIGKVEILQSGGAPDPDNFRITLNASINFTGGYLGGGVFARLSQPLIQTKQFPSYWDQGRQVRLGVQKYLLDRTDAGQITLQIYLSQDPTDPWNAGPIVPSGDSVNDALIYSDYISTAADPDNLQTPISSKSQKQIWHRMNTSLIGDTVQIGFTLSEAQMRDIVVATSEIALQAIILEVFPGPQLG